MERLSQETKEEQAAEGTRLSIPGNSQRKLEV